MPYDTIDVSCLVNIEGGKDLAMICIKGVDKMSVEDIADFIKTKTSKMKRSDGGEEHKKRTGPFKILPAFLVAFLIEVMSYVTNKIGLGIPAMRIEKHAFGAACITALGSLGYEDAIAPFTGFANCSFLLSSNAIAKQPVVEDGKVVVGDVMNCNFVVDHRYVDGGSCANMMRVFSEVFNNPNKFMSGQMKTQQKKE